MKVLFLDVDGVITVADGTGRLCEDKLERLQRVVLQTQSTIVISSNWRLFPQLKTRLVMALHEHGGMRVVGCTPDHGERVHGDAVSLPFPPMPSVGVAPLPTLPFPRRGRGGEQQNQPRHACGSTQIIMLVPTSPPFRAQVRPEEIVAWIKDWRGEPIEAWCAVDDRPLLTERGGAGLDGHFVEVDEMHGLTERAVERLLAVLHTEPDDPEVMGATSTTVAAATPDGDRLSPDSVLSVQPLSSASKPLIPQRLGGKPLGTPAGSRRPRLTAAPPPPLQSSPAPAQGDPLGPRGGGSPLGCQRGAAAAL